MEHAGVALAQRLELPVEEPRQAPSSERRGSIFEHIIGDSVSATTPDTSTAPASVKANSRNRLPVRPPARPIGAYTATSVIVMAMTGSASSRAPWIAASYRDWPSSMCRWMFSTTMMASSTTRPIASTIASRVSRLIE